MPINVVIATFRRPDLLRRTLESLRDAERPRSFEHVLVIENGERGGAEDVCRDLAENGLPIEYHFLSESGSGRARQFALERLKEGFVLFLDYDVRVCPGFLVAYEAAIERGGPAAFYGGPLLIDYESPPPPWLIKHLPPSVRGWDIDDPKWGFFLGTNYGAFAEEILGVGGMSLTLGPGAVRAGTAGNPTGLEPELQRRLLNAGCRQIYVPQAMVWHYVPANSCTPEWALHRAYRNSISRALESDEWSRSRSIFGIPSSLWPRFLRASVKAVVANLLSNEEKRFLFRREFHRCRGYIRGLRMRAARAG
jgi:GT2 family glycosyltransferase